MPSPHSSPPAEEVLRLRMKVELRKRMRAVRRTLPAKARSLRSTRIVDRLLTLEGLAGARSVALFAPIAAHGEVDLSSLDPLLRARGVRIAYPRLIGSEPGPMEFRFVPDAERMVSHPLGMREPCADDPLAARGDLDLIVVPALAADSRGHRLGYGGGTYDRSLPLYAPPAVTVVVVFDFQLVVEMPSANHDVAVDWVVTDARTMPADR